MTIRLLRIVTDAWPDIDGHLALASGIDPLELPIDRLLNLAWAWAIKPAEHADDPEREIEAFRRRLWIPPPGVTPTAGPWTPEAETAAFGAFAAQVQQKPG